MSSLSSQRSKQIPLVRSSQVSCLDNSWPWPGPEDLSDYMSRPHRALSGIRIAVQPGIPDHSLSRPLMPLMPLIRLCLVPCVPPIPEGSCKRTNTHYVTHFRTILSCFLHPDCLGIRTVLLFWRPTFSIVTPHRLFRSSFLLKENKPDERGIFFAAAVFPIKYMLQLINNHAPLSIFEKYKIDSNNSKVELCFLVSKGYWLLLLLLLFSIASCSNKFVCF